MRFPIGFGTKNILLNRENAEAAYRQDPMEHEAELHKYDSPSLSPYEQLMATVKAADEEKLNPKYWDENEPRLDLGGSSSWIDGIEYMPELGIAIMKTNGREYYYPMTPDEVGDWVTSDSLGSYYNNFVKLRE